MTTSTSGKNLTDRVPAYLRIEQDLRNRIREGVWPAGTMLPSRRELAAGYDVDTNTLQRAIAALLQDGTLRADNRRGTFVDASAVQNGAAMARSQANAMQTVAVILDFDPTYAAAQAIPRGVHHALRQKEAPYRMVSFDTHSRDRSEIVEHERHALDVVEREGIAGAILWHGGGEETLPRVQELIARHVPIVFVDRCPSDVSCDFVGVDNYQSAREATDYLLGLGHRRIAFLTTSEENLPIQQRELGYKDALSAAGVRPRNELIWQVPYDLSLKLDMEPAFDHFQALTEPPTAVFAMNDVLAHYFIAHIESQGSRVPEDMSVIGFDDLDRYSPRPALLTTMSQPFELIGQRAAELLLQRMASPAEGLSSQHILLPTKLIARSTCRKIESHGRQSL